ncbi:uncharacterized protein Dana_GF14616 [Drosophila ananassae]|uniref:trypsin n=2 Tax=Drosophila ananassae TaxID=7217 RepID=B3MPK3_DROAN|nr:uncharacterized protein Dana_GF14616 [Drosophila ananassae]
MFLKFFLILAFCSRNIFSIYNGFEADIKMWSFIASVRINGYHECGGTVIESRIILTAAQCVAGIAADNVSIQVGTDDRTKGKGRVVPVTSIIVHDKFLKNSAPNDIALLWLKWTALAGIVRKLPIVEEEPADQNFCSNAGWGEQSLQILGMPRLLLHGMAKVRNRSYCDEELVEQVGEELLCTFYNQYDICPGDYGGPLIYGGFVVGIAVEGHGCGWSKLPSLYTNVYKFRDWIETNSKKLIENK